MIYARYSEGDKHLSWIDRNLLFIIQDLFWSIGCTSRVINILLFVQIWTKWTAYSKVGLDS